MLTTSRRDLILSAAVAGAALGLDKSLAIAAPVESQQTPAAPVRSQHNPAAPVPRQQTPDPKPGYFRYKVGDAECTALYDGIWEKAHDPKYFGNATTAEIKQALANAGLTTAFVPIPITVFIIKLNGKLVLCDVGGGNQVQAFNPQSIFVSGKMMANMKAAGIDPKAIESILISHFHPDHIFGLLEKNTNALRGAGRSLDAFRPSSRTGRTCFRSKAKTKWCPGSTSSRYQDTRLAIRPSLSAPAIHS